MKTWPLDSLSVEEAAELQFSVVDAITRHFSGDEFLNLGGLGIEGPEGKPSFTRKCERVIADVFGAEDALLVRGAGTGAIREGMISLVGAGDTVLIHDAPLYPTTRELFEAMGLRTVRVDMNEARAVTRAASEHPEIRAALVQHARQKIDDRYSLRTVIEAIHEGAPALPVLTDDNYAALKTRVGCQLGAQLTAFSCFKLLGPEGVGALVGEKRYITKAAARQYSGGCQVQGREAREVLQGMTYAPVALALQARECQKLCELLTSGALPGVRSAYIANAQSKVVLVEFDREIGADVVRLAERFGAAAHPVGCESRYELTPMIYRVSGTFREADPALARRMIRINPLRGGAETILRILRQALDALVQPN